MKCISDLIRHHPAKNETGLILVKGRFDAEKIVNYAKQRMAEHDEDEELRHETYNDYTIYALEKEDAGICFVGKNLVVVGGKPMLKEWVG